MTNRTQRQPAVSVRIPPKRTPAAPPRPDTAPQTPSAVCRSRAERNVVVKVDSAAGESIAAPIPWAKRIVTSKIGARMPMLAYVGSKPMMKVATPMMSSE